MTDSLAALTEEIRRFRDERDWKQFHTPRQLATGLTIEAAELMETMLWKDDGEVATMLRDPQQSVKAAFEVADVLIFALLFCDAAGIEPGAAIREKLRLNAAKYPADKARGRATKYTDL